MSGNRSRNTANDASRRRSILALTSIYPRPRRPWFGLFNYQALRELAGRTRLSLVSPVSWIDRARDRRLMPAGAAGPDSTDVPGTAPGLEPVYVPYLSIPFAGRGMNGYMQYRAVLPVARSMHRRRPFEFILSYWAYPDGYAACRLSRSLGVPYAVVALGSDLAIMTRSGITAARIRETLAGAARVICVSESLWERACALGAAAERCRVVPNGIDPARFAPLPRAECRTRLGIGGDERMIVFIGNMDPVKGVDVLLQALAAIDRDPPLAILIGSGRRLGAYERQAAALGLSGRVTFAGPVPHRDTALFLNAADLLVLPSRSEGCPNVVLEALACGTPVVASSVGGVPELIRSPEQGILVPPRQPAALAEAIVSGVARSWSRDDIARTSTRTWATVAGETLAIIDEYLDSGSG